MSMWASQRISFDQFTILPWLQPMPSCVHINLM